MISNYFPFSFNLLSPPPHSSFSLLSRVVAVDFTVSPPASMAPRWKGKASEAKALADPISSTVLHLQSSFIQSNARGLLSGSTILYLADEEQTDLLNRTCFGRQILTAEKDKQWFQFGMEEAFYLSYHLNCLKIVDGQDCEMNFQELWRYMKTQKATFPEFYIAYRHLRLKNWVVRPGSQYGVDFVAYRHHPALVHSEFAVLVLSEGRDSNGNGRLRVWSDFLCTIRLCGSVAKTLLVLSVNDNGSEFVSPSCLDSYSIEERTVTRWSPEQCRENPAEV
ncbi:tRNA-splicing endonuclease subunit Sen2-1 isoform X2 [Cucumis melo]|uniref:tRNA-intron lyase n=2 Tax=Cucumis melo TaxID=3656 RepID=A0A1S3CK86_CUCME|nr:tRNA-splicing endonuclease subunit Sen2-1 isoform X2 [Cucumis melo]